MSAAVIVGALTWGVLWSLSVVTLHRRADSGRGGRWWDFGVNAATGVLMAWFAIKSCRALEWAWP